MGVDVRQIAGAILTLSMFVMLGNMIKKDHFSDTTATLEVNYSNGSAPSEDAVYATSKGLLTKEKEPNNLWRTSEPALNPCWDDKITKSTEKSAGFVQFRLSNGPHYHVSQVADAIVVAKYLGATLVLPEIKGSSTDENRSMRTECMISRYCQGAIARMVGRLLDILLGYSGSQMVCTWA